MDSIIKQEKTTLNELQIDSHLPYDIDVDSYLDLPETGTHENEKSINNKSDYSGVILPPGFLDPLSPLPDSSSPSSSPSSQTVTPSQPSSSIVDVVDSCKQFWKAGDYEVPRTSAVSSGGLDHVRVHPKFLHSNATSHKWALGALAELLDNSVDEVCHGATYVNVDMLENKKDRSKRLLVEDNGGGMNPDIMRHCMSFGYSVKSKMGDTIGQYGNGFKTSTMRLGADVIVFSRYLGEEGKSATQSVGMLSYTFLRSTRKDDIVVPIVDYERSGQNSNKIIRSTIGDWKSNLETIVQWSPYSSEIDLLQEFDLMNHQGTRIVIYNLWHDDQGELELDFDTDLHDIQIRGANRDETKIEMANKFPNSRHFLTYRHSLRMALNRFIHFLTDYSSILYHKLPAQFRIILCGKDVKHHNTVSDMMLVKKNSYRPTSVDEVPKDTKTLYTDVTLGFVKDAKEHIDVQGFNVYHKNRLIKPFWRVWNAAGSDGRGVIGVLEANFVEPAHDKQGFENTPLLERLKARLLQMQKSYWYDTCHKVGYAARNKRGRTESQSKAYSPNPKSPRIEMKHDESKSASKDQLNRPSIEYLYQNDTNPQPKEINKYGPSLDVHLNLENQQLKDRVKRMQEYYSRTLQNEREKNKMIENKSKQCSTNSDAIILDENNHLKERLKEIESSFSRDIQIEKERFTTLEDKLKEKKREIEELYGETEALSGIFSEERSRRDNEEANLREKMKEACDTIEMLRKRVVELEYKCSSSICKQEKR